VDEPARRQRRRPRSGGLRFVPVAVFLGLLVAVGGCEAGTQTARGVVVAVDAPTATDVRGFTLRTDDGELLTFRIGRLTLGGDAFPAVHLREHLRTLDPIVVVYRLEDGERVALRLTDAPR